MSTKTMFTIVGMSSGMLMVSGAMLVVLIQLMLTGGGWPELLAIAVVCHFADQVSQGFHAALRNAMARGRLHGINEATEALGDLPEQYERAIETARVARDLFGKALLAQEQRRAEQDPGRLN